MCAWWQTAAVTEPAFDEVRRDVFRLHGEGDYRAAAEALEQHWRRFPKREPILYFWRMCLASRLGDTGGALGLFDEALAKGYWWGEGFLADADLEAARAAPGWEDRAGECARRQEVAARGPRPAPRVVVPDREPVGVLVALHGWGAAPGEGEDWRPAIEAGWTVVLPRGSTPQAVDAWGWDPRRDAHRVPGWIREGLQGFAVAPLVLAGFSMGAGLACRIAFEGSVPADGVVAVAPTFRHFGMPWPGAPALRRVPAYLVVGEHDWAREEVAGYAPQLESGGWPVCVEEKSGTYHEFPADFPEVLPRALAWCRAGEAGERP